MRGIISNRMLKDHHAIKALTLSDFGVWSGSNLINTIFPLFVLGQIHGATVTEIGIGTMIYMGIAAISNIPLGKFMDSHPGYIDELYLLAASNFIRGVVLIIMAFTHSLWIFYLTQFVAGLAKSMNVMSWRVLFTKFLDVNNVGRQWGIYDTIMSIGFAISAFLGGLIGEKLGFNIVILIGGIMALISTIFPLMSYRDVKGVK